MKINLRNLQSEDWPHFAKWWKDEELINMTSGDHTPITEEEIRNQVEDMASDTNSHHFLIIADDEVIGHINLNKLDSKKAELQIVIGEKEYWGQGIGKEAIRKMIEIAEDLELEKIIIELRPENSRALNLYKKSDFKQTGIKKYPENPNQPEVIIMEKEI